MTMYPKSARHPGLIRRLLAICYDVLLLLALYFVATAVVMKVFNHGEVVQPGQPVSWLLTVLLVVISFLFYGWFWTHGGQTLGMKSWKIRLIQADGSPVTWQLAFIRFVAAVLSWAVFGLGFLWSLLDSRNRTWHDIASGSELQDLR